MSNIDKWPLVRSHFGVEKSHGRAIPKMHRTITAIGKYAAFEKCRIGTAGNSEIFLMTVSFSVNPTRLYILFFTWEIERIYVCFRWIAVQKCTVITVKTRCKHRYCTHATFKIISPRGTPCIICTYDCAKVYFWRLHKRHSNHALREQRGFCFEHNRTRRFYFTWTNKINDVQIELVTFSQCDSMCDNEPHTIILVCIFQFALCVVFNVKQKLRPVCARNTGLFKIINFIF